MLGHERPNPQEFRAQVPACCSHVRRDESSRPQAFYVKKVFVRSHDLRIARNRDERLLHAVTEKAAMLAHDTPTAIIMKDGIQHAFHNTMRLGPDAETVTASFPYKYHLT
jgi:hypothetical protein